MSKLSLLFLVFFSGSVFASAPTPSPTPYHRPRIADLERGGGTTVAERHPWIQRVENLLQIGLVIVFGLHSGGHSR